MVIFGSRKTICQISVSQSLAQVSPGANNEMLLTNYNFCNSCQSMLHFFKTFITHDTAVMVGFQVKTGSHGGQKPAQGKQDTKDWEPLGQMMAQTASVQWQRTKGLVSACSLFSLVWDFTLLQYYNNNNALNRHQSKYNDSNERSADMSTTPQERTGFSWTNKQNTHLTGLLASAGALVELMCSTTSLRSSAIFFNWLSIFSARLYL